MAAYALAPPEVAATMASLCTLAPEHLDNQGAPQRPATADARPLAHEQPPAAAITTTPDMHSAFFNFEAAAGDAERPLVHEQPPAAAITITPDMHSALSNFEAAAGDAEPISAFAARSPSAGSPAQSITAGGAQPPTHAPMLLYATRNARAARHAHASARRTRAHTRAHDGD